MGPDWWNRNFYRNWIDVEKLIRDVLSEDEVSNTLSRNRTVTMKVRKGGRVYRVKVEDITVEDAEEISIEFEGDEPSKHPDYTE